MAFRKAFRAGLAIFAVGVLAQAAQARPAHNPQPTAQQSYSFGFPQVVFRERAPSVSGTHGPLLEVAKRYVGRGKITHYRGPWCRDFVNVVARQAGYRLKNNSRRAIDALSLGHRVSSPQPGDLVVMKHHVTIYAGRENGKVVGLGGNQSHRVRYSTYPVRKVLAFVRL